MHTFDRIRSFLVPACLTLLLLATAGRAAAASVPPAAPGFALIDRYVAEEMKELGVPGMQLGIVHGDQVVHLQGFGVTDSAGRLVTPRTPFHIGSLTKTFTALAVMQLVEAGKIDLDAPVRNYLPWFDAVSKDSLAEVTVRELLNHTSGFSQKDGNRAWRSRGALEETLRGFGTLPLTRAPGAGWEYSNLNYSLAGLIVEKASGQSYSDYLAQHILAPLDMRHTYTSHQAALADGLSMGHYYMFGRAIEREGPLPPVYLPAGMLISTAEDLGHFAIAQLNDGRYGEVSVLSARGMVEMHTPTVATGRGAERFALGWGADAADGLPVLRHDGDTGRFHAIILLQPDSKWAVVLLANASGFVEMYQVDDMAERVLEMLNGRAPAPVPAPLMMRSVYWGILLFPLVQVVGIVHSWRNRRGAREWRAPATVLLSAALAFGFLQLPIPMPIPSMLLLYPEVAYGLITIATLGFGWALVYTVLYLRKWMTQLGRRGDSANPAPIAARG